MNEAERNEIYNNKIALESIEKHCTGDTYQCMIDIETWSLEQNAAILAITYVIFKKDEPNLKDSIKYFKTINIHKYTQIELFKRTVSEKTESFWNDPKLLKIKNSLQKDGRGLTESLSMMAEELSRIRINEFWANSPTFDMMILESAFKAVNLENYIPWKFYQLRDVRTVTSLSNEKFGRVDKKNLINSVLELNVEKDLMSEHHPLFDCLIQIKNLIHFIEKLNNEGKNNNNSIPIMVQGKKAKIELDLTFIE